MEAEPLTKACELVFAVALQGAEADPPIEAPASMRSFLYLPQLPRRALTVARRAVEDDPAFRARVAAQATVDNVGRAGYLWLNQMPGWEHEVQTDVGVDELPAVPPVPRPPMPPEPHAGGPTPPPPAPPAPPPSPATAATRSQDSIEEELASLRTLVGRLSEERETTHRQMVETPKPQGSTPPPAPPVPAPVAPSVPRAASTGAPSPLVGSVPGDLADLNDRLRTTNERLSEAYARLNTSSQELDDAKRVASEYAAARDRALTDREALLAAQAKLEVELAELRQKVNQSQQLIDAEVAAKDAEAAAKGAAEQAAATAAAEVAQVRSELEAARAVDRQHQAEAEEAERALQAALDAAAQETAALADRAAAAEQARLELEGQLERMSGQWQAVKVELAQLADERRALADRLAADTRRQEAAAAERRSLFDDFAAHLGKVEAERDRLAGEVQHLTTRLDATRNALDAATRSVALEVDAATLALGGVNEAMNGLDGSLDATHERLAGLAPALSEAGAPDETVEADPIAVHDEPAPTSDPFDGRSSADDDHALESVMNSYGFGSETDASDEVEPIDLDATVEAEPVDDAIGTDLDTEDAGADTDDVIDAEFDVVDAELELDAEADDQLEPDSTIDDDVSDDTVWFDRSDAGASTPSMPPMPPPEFSAVASVDDADRVAPMSFADALGQGTTTSVTETDLERALRLASTTDVVMLVDGDPTATMGWRDHSVYDRRRFLLEKLDQVTAEYGPALNVVFDPEVGGEDDLPSSNYVRPWLVQNGVDTAAALSDLIGRYPNHFPIAVVTDDPRLRAELDQRSIEALDVVALLDLIVALPDQD